MGSRGVFTARGALLVCIVLSLSSFRSAEGHWGPWWWWRRTNSVVSVINNIREPTFNLSVSVPWRRAPAIDFFEAAADIDRRFRFSATFYGSELGYLIDVINGLRANFSGEQTWWMVTNASGIPHNVGISNYYPSYGEAVQLIFTNAPEPSQG